MTIRRWLAVGAATATTAVAAVPMLALGAHAAVRPHAVIPAPGSPVSRDLAPTGASTLHEPLLSWGAVTGASSYEVELALNSSFRNGIALDQSVPTTAFAVPQTLAHGSYHWRVRAAGGTWSAAQQITTAWSVAPGSGATDTADGDLSWAAVPGADVYQVEFSQTGFASDGNNWQYQPPADVKTCFTTNTHLTPYDGTTLAGQSIAGGSCDSMLDGTLGAAHQGTVDYWRVRAWDTSAATVSGADYTTDSCQGLPNDGTSAVLAGECGLWSSESAVKEPTAPAAVASPSGEAPVLQVPTTGCSTTGGTTDCSSTPSLTWSAPSDGAAFYEVTLSVDPGDAAAQSTHFATTMGPVKTAFTSVTPRIALPANTAGHGYHAVVQACKEETGPKAVCTLASNQVTFTVTDPAAPAVGTPSDAAGDSGAVLHARQVSLPFSTVAGAGAYEVQVTTDDDANFDKALVVDDTVDAPLDTVLLADDSYIWRVLPLDGTGQVRNAEVSTGSFLVDTTAPVGTLAAGGALPLTGGTVGVTFSKPVSVTDQASIQLIPAHGGTPVSGVATTGRDLSTVGVKLLGALTPGESYTLSIAPSVVDAGGLSAVPAAGSVTATTAVDQTSPVVTKSAGWSTKAASDAYGSSFDLASPSASSHPTESVIVHGSSFGVYGCTGPNYGYLDIYVDGTRVAQANEYSSVVTCHKLLFAKTLDTTTTHSIKVYADGGHASNSTGSLVGVDEIVG